REGVFREMKLRSHYEKPSERKVREKAEAIRRARKLARKKLQREGLLPMKPKVVAGRPGPGRAPRFWPANFRGHGADAERIIRGPLTHQPPCQGSRRACTKLPAIGTA